MGSNSDWDVMKNAAEMLQSFDVPFEAKVVSAHRMPDEMFEYAETARDRGIRVIIAGAGGAAHLPVCWPLKRRFLSAAFRSRAAT